MQVSRYRWLLEAKYGSADSERNSDKNTFWNGNRARQSERDKHCDGVEENSGVCNIEGAYLDWRFVWMQESNRNRRYRYKKD